MPLQGLLLTCTRPGHCASLPAGLRRCADVSNFMLKCCSGQGGFEEHCRVCWRNRPALLKSPPRKSPLQVAGGAARADGAPHLGVLAGREPLVQRRALPCPHCHTWLGPPEARFALHAAYARQESAGACTLLVRHLRAEQLPPSILHGFLHVCRQGGKLPG